MAWMNSKGDEHYEMEVPALAVGGGRLQNLVVRETPAGGSLSILLGPKLG